MRNSREVNKWRAAVLEATQRKQDQLDKEARAKEAEENRKRNSKERWARKRAGKKRFKKLQKEVTELKTQIQKMHETRSVQPLRTFEPRDPFFDRREWQLLRYQVIKLYGRKCMCCGKTDGEIHVDHIKPRSRYPHLAMDINNLQVLCRDCNLGKSDLDEIDWRPHARILRTEPNENRTGVVVLPVKKR